MALGGRKARTVFALWHRSRSNEGGEERASYGWHVAGQRERWERLLEAGRLLSLNGDMFERVVNVLQIGNAEEYDKIAEVVNINELTNEEVIQVLSVREDFMRRE